MHDAAARMVGNRPGIGDHEEGEQQQRATLQLMKPHGAALAEPEHAQRENAEMAAEECDRHVGAPRALHDQRTERDEPPRERDVVAPLARRHPRARQREQREDHAEVAGIEDVLAANAYSELRADRDQCRQRMRPRIVGAQQQRQAERRDRGAAHSLGLHASAPLAEALRGERRGEGQQALLGSDREITPPGPGAQKNRQCADLEQTRIVRQA